MAKKDKVYERRCRILAELKSGPVSILEMAECIGVSRRTVESDIKALKEEGSEIEVKKDIITLMKCEDIAIESSQKDVRAVNILMLLGESAKGLTVAEIVDKLSYDTTEDLIGRKDRRKKHYILYSEQVKKMTLLYVSA